MPSALIFIIPSYFIVYWGQTSSQVMLIFMEMKMTDNVASAFFLKTATSIFLAFHKYAELAY